MRTQIQIDEQINRLNLLRGTLPAYSKLGTPNHEIIDKQIEILQGDIIDEDEIYELEDELGTENLSGLFDALNWIDGDDSIELVSDDDLPLFDINKIAKQINFPTKKWEGNCHGVATQIVESGMIDGKVERGYWKGDVSKRSIFYGKPLIPHSWIRMSNGKIADPTRWCFEQVTPYIFVGGNDYYDVGGNDFRMENMTPCPEFNPSHKECKIKFPKSCNKFVMNLIGNPPYLTINHAMWISNLSLKVLSPYAKEIFTAFDKAKEGCLIPMDNYNIVMK